MRFKSPADFEIAIHEDLSRAELTSEEIDEAICELSSTNQRWCILQRLLYLKQHDPDEILDLVKEINAQIDGLIEFQEEMKKENRPFETD